MGLGLALLIGAAGVVQLSRNPDRTARRMAFACATLMLAGFTIFVFRGDLFRDSGLDDEGVDACAYERGC